MGPRNVLKPSSASVLLANNASEWWVLVYVTLRGHPPSATTVPAVLSEKLADGCAGSSQEQRGQRKRFGVARDECLLDHWLSCPASTRTRLLSCRRELWRERQRENKKERIMTITSNENLLALHTRATPLLLFEHRLCEMLAKPVRLPLFRKTGQTIMEIESWVSRLCGSSTPRGSV